MAWMLLVFAGLMEAVWASALPATHGLTRPWPTALFLGALAISMVALARASQTLPLGTAYAVWVGIGVVGATIAGVVRYGEALSVARAGFLVLLLVAIVGLKLTSSTS